MPTSDIGRAPEPNAAAGMERAKLDRLCQNIAVGTDALDAGIATEIDDADLDAFLDDLAPPGSDEPPEPDRHTYVRAAIEEGRAQIGAGEGIPADKAWKELGIE